MEPLGTALLALILLLWGLVLWEFVRPLFRCQAAAPSKSKPLQKAAPARTFLSSSGGNKHYDDNDKKKHPLTAKGAGGVKRAGPASSGSHPLLVNTLKGHNDVINGLAFALDADGVNFQLATACDDNTVRLFKLTDELGAKSFHIIRINLELQKATAVAFGRNASEVIVASSGAAGGARLAKYHVPDAPGKPPVLKWQVPAAHGKHDVASLTAVPGEPRGRPTVVVSCSDTETNLGLWYTGTGKLAERINSNQMVNYMVSASPDGRFFACAAFTAEVKLWEMQWGKAAGDPVKAVKVMHLQGHKTAVTACAFNADSTRMVTASKDGLLIVWDIAVRYQLNEDTKIVRRIACAVSGRHYSHLALSARGVLAATVDSAGMFFVDVETGETVGHVPQPHDTDVRCMVWAPAPRTAPSLAGGSASGGHAHELLATAAADRKVKLWRSPV